MNLCSTQQVKTFLNEHGFKPRKRFGQNFLVDRNILNIIVDAAEAGPESHVLEVGPGLGSVTQELSSRACEVVAVEIDDAMIAALGITLSECVNTRVVKSDILKTSPEQLGLSSDVIWTLVGNLPYYITSPILEWIATYKDHFNRAVLMVQKEVAQRLLSSPGSEDYSSLTAYLSYFFTMSKVANVSKNVFYPAPDVDSAVICLQTHSEPPVNVIDKEILFAVIRASFGMRRKTLLNALGSSPVLRWGKDTAGEVLICAGIDPGRRGETLSLEEFAKVADAYSNR